MNRRDWYRTVFGNTNDRPTTVIKDGRVVVLKPGDTITFEGPNPNNRANVMPAGVVVKSSGKVAR